MCRLLMEIFESFFLFLTKLFLIVTETIFFSYIFTLITNSLYLNIFEHIFLLFGNFEKGRYWKCGYVGETFWGFRINFGVCSYPSK